MIIDDADGDLYAGVTQQYDIKNRSTGMTTEITTSTAPSGIREVKFEYCYNFTIDLPEFLIFNNLYNAYYVICLTSFIQVE